MKKNYLEIISKFNIEGTVKNIKPFGTGLINDTFLIQTSEEDKDNYILQKINHNIFTNVEQLQNNIISATEHIRKKLIDESEKDVKRKVLSYIYTHDNKSYYFDGENYWRIMIFIERSHTYEAITPELSMYTGEAMGKFERMLADIPTELSETIPNFHNMEFRLKQFHDAIKEDRANRVKEVEYYIDEMEKRSEYMCMAEHLHREGILPKRICHCDTKVNNILFDEDGNVLCVIDLDTLMPSYIFSDFGDFMRTAANTGAEDDRNLDNVNFNMDIFRAFTKGYLKTAKSFLLPVEIDNLPYAAALFPYMQCVRFLTDYINGDTYYKIKYPQHNLDRTKAQFKLLQSVEEHMEEMKDFIISVKN